jgi:polyphosphate kinase 2 (PPK2 family)
VVFSPTTGEIVLFDRSWYNRASIGRMMNFCTEDEYQHFLIQVPEFEEMLIDSGVRLFKYCFSVSRDEQFSRFQDRKKDPLKH